MSSARCAKSAGCKVSLWPSAKLASQCVASQVTVLTASAGAANILLRIAAEYVPNQHSVPTASRPGPSASHG